MIRFPRVRACALAILLAAPAAHALDLPAALREVAAANPALSASRERSAATRARIAPAGAWSAPMLELGVVNVPTNGAFDEDPMTMKMLGLAQRLPLSGANGLARRAAREAWQAELADAEQLRWEILGEAWQAYADAYHAHELVHHAEHHAATMDALVASARTRYSGGGGRLEDVLAAEAERGRSRADLADWRAEERAARAQLDRLRGVDPGGAGEALSPPPADSTGDDDWRRAVSERHPRLRAAAATEQRWTFAARSMRRMTSAPDLEIRASYGRRGMLADGTKQDDMFSVTGAIMLPVFAGSRERSQATEMDAMARAAAADRRGAELDLRARIEQSLAERAAARERVSLLADTIVVAQRAAFEATRRAWTAGFADLPRVLDSEHALYVEEVALERARQQLARSTAALVSLAARGDLVGIPLPADSEGASK